MSKTNKNSQLKSPYKIFKKKKIHHIKPIKIQNRINEKKKKKKKRRNSKRYFRWCFKLEKLQFSGFFSFFFNKNQRKVLLKKINK